MRAVLGKALKKSGIERLAADVGAEPCATRCRTSRSMAASPAPACHAPPAARREIGFTSPRERLSCAHICIAGDEHG